MQMLSATRDYLSELASAFGAGWNRFWFTPIDPLPLCVIRVMCGLLALYLVAAFSPDLDRLFGPAGMAPLDAVDKIQAIKEFSATPETDPPLFRFSYLDYLTTTQSLWAGHLVGLAILAAFTAGLFSRVTAVLALGVFISYIQRGPMLTWLVEPVLAFMLFYLCFGPCGAYLSVDAWLRRRREAAVTFDARRGVRPSWTANMALRLIQVHVCLVYVMMVLSKLFSDVWWNGEAMWWLASKLESRLVPLTWLHDYEYLVNAWTHAQVAYELLFPVLIWNRLARPLLIAVGVVMWSLLALVAGAAPFAFVMIAASVAFITAEGLRVCCSCFGREKT